MKNALNGIFHRKRRSFVYLSKEAKSARSEINKRVTEAFLAVASKWRSKRLESKNSSSLVIPTNKKCDLYGRFFVAGNNELVTSIEARG